MSMACTEYTPPSALPLSADVSAPAVEPTSPQPVAAAGASILESCGGGESNERASRPANATDEQRRPAGRHWPSPSYAQSAEPMGDCIKPTEAGVAPGPQDTSLPLSPRSEQHDSDSQSNRNQSIDIFISGKGEVDHGRIA